MNKKILFVIVEGMSDDEAIHVVLSRIFRDKNVLVKIYHGDISSEIGVHPTNIASRINKIVREYIKDYHLKMKDLYKIVQITDTDGTYIDDELIVYDGDLDEVIYSEDTIKTSNPQNIIERNQRKSINLNRLASINDISNVAYEIYYMSSNLDHVLYNKLNTSNYEKEINAHNFSKKYKDQPEEFIKFMTESDFSVKASYKETWDYIKKENNSLKRHTNFGICFKDLEDDLNRC